MRITILMSKERGLLTEKGVKLPQGSSNRSLTDMRITILMSKERGLLTEKRVKLLQTEPKHYHRKPRLPETDSKLACH